MWPGARSCNLFRRPGPPSTETGTEIDQTGSTALDPAPRTSPRTNTCAAARSPGPGPILSRFCRDPGLSRDKSSNSASYSPLREHTHAITNINEDGTIPAVEATNWLEPGLNNYRQNKQPDGAFAAPDAIVSLLYPKCIGDFALVAVVRNLGTAVLPPGAQVEFYKGDQPNGELIGTAATKLALFPAQAEQVAIELGDTQPDVQSGDIDVYAVVTTPSAECRTDNNTSKQDTGQCMPPN